MSKIRVLIVEPNKEPYQKRINHTLEDMQNVVGGLIEFVELEHNVDLICNEEGKIYNLPMNRAMSIMALRIAGATYNTKEKQFH